VYKVASCRFEPRLALPSPLLQVLWIAVSTAPCCHFLGLQQAGQGRGHLAPCFSQFAPAHLGCAGEGTRVLTNPPCICILEARLKLLELCNV
jgi:hypothetical protein